MMTHWGSLSWAEIRSLWEILQAGTTFPTTVSPSGVGPGGGQDLFVAELDANGTLAGGFATVIGGSNTESANGVAVDGSGNIYVAGQTDSTDLFTSPILPYPGGSNDAFLFKLASGGGSITYSTYLGGSKSDLATGIAVNAADNSAYLSGIADSPGIAGASNSLLGTEDGFAAKFDSSGHQVYFTYVGGSASLPPATPATDGDAIAVDSTGIAYITGKTSVSDLPL